MLSAGPQDHVFWLQVMQEHAEFIYDHLSPRETALTRQAEEFYNLYLRLKNHVAQTGDVSQAFAQEALQAGRRFRDYKIGLLRDRIDNNIVLNLTPAFFNGIIMELEEYLRLLSAQAAGQAPPPENVFHHLFLWLPDQIGHASLLIKELDITEREITAQATAFSQQFTGIYLNTILMSGYARAGDVISPAMERLVEQTAEQVQGFFAVVQKALALFQSDKLYSRTTATFLAHHFGESIYFLRKLGEATPQVARRRPELFLPPSR